MGQESATAFIIRPAKNVEEAKEFWWPQMQLLGWNRDANDADTHFKVAQNSGWLVLIPNDEDEKKAKGTIIPFTYNNGTGWVAFFILAEEHRGKGWGRVLFQALLDSFKASNTTFVGLDGVLQQVKTYERRGFVTKAIIKVHRRVSLKHAPLSVKKEELGEGEKFVDLRDVPFNLLAKSDLAHTGFERPTLWTEEALFSRPDVFGFAIVSSTDSNKLLSWAMVRRNELGHRYGPVYAETPALAKKVLCAAIEKANSINEDSIGEAEVFTNNPEAIKVFEDLDFTYAIDYYRMWLDGRVPQQQAEGGKGEKEMFAVFDAAAG